MLFIPGMPLAIGCSTGVVLAAVAVCHDISVLKTGCRIVGLCLMKDCIFSCMINLFADCKPSGLSFSAYKGNLAGASGYRKNSGVAACF